MKTNLEKYAAGMSRKIKEGGLDCYHWSEVSTVIDELLKYAVFYGASQNKEQKATTTEDNSNNKPKRVRR
jgi:hypothetical protein